MASKANGNIDDPGAFAAREWLRKKVVGKQVAFETRYVMTYYKYNHKDILYTCSPFSTCTHFSYSFLFLCSKQGATAGDRVYGLLFMQVPGTEDKINLAVEAVRNGHATPKVFGTQGEEEAPIDVEDPVAVYEQQLHQALQEATSSKVGIHSSDPGVRSIQNAGEEFSTKELIEAVKKYCDGGQVTCVIEYIFDGSRFRLHVTDSQLSGVNLQYANFTLILGGVASPRVGNPRASPPTVSEPFAEEAKQFVEARLLHRELKISLHGTDKSGICAVGTVHHPRGNIGIELLKQGLARVSDWSARMMNPLDVPAFRVAENNAKVS